MSGIDSASWSCTSTTSATGRRLDERTARELLQLTRLMVAAAHADDWDTVALHDTSRRTLLADSPDGTPGQGLPASLTEALIAADKAVLEQARRARDVFVDGTHRVRAERDARNTYARVMQDDGRTGS